MENYTLLSGDNPLLPDNLERPTIPESKFIQHILPLLKDEDGTQFNKMWLRLTGNRTNIKVDLTDANGDVVFTVPPLRPSYQTQPSKSLGLLASEFVNMSGVSPLRAQTFLGREMPKLVSLNSLFNTAVADAWGDVLVRYGMGDLVESNVVSNEPTSLLLMDDDDDWD